MILTKILKLCKKKKLIQIVRYGSHKFLAAGTTAGYIDDDAADWTAEDCAIAIGVSEDEREGFILTEERYPALDVSDMQEAVPMKYEVARHQPFMLADKSVCFVKSEKLSVFDEVNNVRYYVGLICTEADSGKEEYRLIVASDTFPVGVIAPERVNLNAVKAFAKELSAGLAIAERIGFFDAGGQMEIEEPSEAESEDDDE